jgi:AAA domain
MMDARIRSEFEAELKAAGDAIAAAQTYKDALHTCAEEADRLARAFEDVPSDQIETRLFEIIEQREWSPKEFSDLKHVIRSGARGQSPFANGDLPSNQPQWSYGAGCNTRINGERRTKPGEDWKAKLTNVRDLCDMRFPEIRYVVPGIFPEGVTLLVSRPKLGKSWLLLQLGSAIGAATPTPVLKTEDEPYTHGDVLYLALEDNERRMQRRLTKLFGGLRECWPGRLTVATKWRRLDQGGSEDLREWCKSVPNPTLIMIDTLKHARSPKKTGQSDYDADYEACAPLLRLTQEFPGLAIIAAHHDRKMDAEDVFDTVSGTLGLNGGVDTIAILKRNAQGVTLHVEGRDLEDSVKKAVHFDRETGRWAVLGEAADVHRSEARARVLDVLRDGPADGMSVSEIMGCAGIKQRDAADKLLQRMAKAGEIIRLKRGKYALPGRRMSDLSETRRDH